MRRVEGMPIYEFKCLKCDEFFELLVMGNDEKSTMHCPKCKSEDFERVLSTTNYSMPGGGGSGCANQRFRHGNTDLFQRVMHDI